MCPVDGMGIAGNGPVQEWRKVCVHQGVKVLFPSLDMAIVQHMGPLTQPQAAGFLCHQLLGHSLDFWERRVGNFIIK